VREGLRKGRDDGSIRPDVDVEQAADDITSTVFGIAFQWVVLPDVHDLERELLEVRARIIRDYG
jgi:BetI-type transcriptional repressor, C-terminal